MIASKPDEESSSKKTEKARDAVADLERRLAMIGATDAPAAASETKPAAATVEAPSPLAFATPPTAAAATTTADATTGSKSGKNALLVS